MTDSAIELGRIARLAGIHSVGTFERRDSDVGVAILAHLDSTGRLIPAEPAEEETKADRLYNTNCLYCEMLQGPCSAHKDWVPSPRPASSPVAPTETGPWPTWQEVPEGVTVKAANGERFRKTGVGAIHLLTNGVGDCCKISVAYGLQPAPFVAAEEG